MLEIYWGTALLQRVPCDSSSMLFRIMAGVLVNLGFPFSQLEKAFPVCDKTLRKWGRALKAKTPSRMQALLSGHTARRELSAEQKQYVRMRYSELKENTSAYREKIRDELFRYWGKNVTGELLRPIFREVDSEHCAGDEHSNSESADSDTESGTAAGAADAELGECTLQDDSQKGRKNACAGSRQNGGSNSEPCNDCSVSEDAPPHHSDESDRSSELSTPESDSGTENSEYDCERPPFSNDPPESEGTEPSTPEIDTSANPPGTVTAETCAGADSEACRNNACAQTLEIAPERREPRNDCSVSKDAPPHSAESDRSSELSAPESDCGTENNEYDSKRPPFSNAPPESEDIEPSTPEIDTSANPPGTVTGEACAGADSEACRNNACAQILEIAPERREPRNDCSVSEDAPPHSAGSDRSSDLSTPESDCETENNEYDSERPPFSNDPPESEDIEPSAPEIDTSANPPGTVTGEACTGADSEACRNNACAQTLEIAPERREPRNDCSVPPTLPARAAIDTAALHGRCGKAFFSHHAGLFTLLPWLQQAVGDTEPTIQQFALQVLAGAPNWEQSRQLDFEGLGLLCPTVLRTPRVQSRWFKENAFGEKIDDVFRRNAALINMTGGRIFYFDPHTEKYTGKFKILLGWCGSIHGIDKALHLDFIHTETGDPCHVRHFDNYEDMRRRFLISREQFRALFPHSSPSITWVADRGIWSVPFLQNVANLDDTFATWEKGYSEGAWEWADVVNRGKFTKWRFRNSRGDRRRYRFHWYEQRWDKIAGGRRFIVRAVNPEGRCIEVSIVTNAAALSAEKIVWLMFNRWVQENDFAYLKRHFGIGELTERGFDYYSEIADELEDRQQESRQHKRARNKKKQREKELSEKLLKMRPVQDLPTLEELHRQEDELQQEVQRLKAELNNIRAEQNHQQSHTVLDRVEDKVNDLKQRFRQNKAHKEHAQKRDRLETEARAIEQHIEELEEQLRNIPRTESRIQALIDEEYVRLKMRSKPLADAVRITARNVFIQPLRIFRGIWNNRRNDHAVLRAITRSAGLVIPHGDRLEIVLYPQLELQPAEWPRVYRLLHICECRIREMQDQPHDPRIVFTLCTSNKEMMCRLSRQG